MDIKSFKRPLFIAHRGFKKSYPENTIAAFDAALRAGAKMIELDVTLTKDRRPVVVHDKTLDRTTNGSGTVTRFTFDELQKLDAGSWFSPEFKNEKLPGLDQILHRYGKSVMINIEIKPEAYEEEQRADSIENQVIELVHQYNCMNSVIISSFSDELILRFGKYKNRPATAFLTETPADETTVELIKTAGAFSWNTDYQILTREQVALMHHNDIPVFAYTVNEKEIAIELVEMGVDGIFTDDIEAFISL